MNQISVIVPTLNRSEEISLFIDTLCKQTMLPDELVVVDAGPISDLEQRIRIQLDGSGISFVYARGKAGTSLQRNVAIEKASGDILFFFDDDILLEPTYIEETMHCFSLPYDPPVGGVLGTFTSPYRLPWTKKLYFRFFRIAHTVDGNEAKMMSSSDIRWLIKPSKVVPVPVCSGGRVAFRKECFDRELWDDFLPGYTMGEDVEISCRIGKHWTFVQTPKALLFHDKSENTRNSRSERIARRVFSRFYIFQKNIPKTPRNIIGFAWWNIGISVLYSTTGTNKRDDIQGLKRGYKLCWNFIRGKEKHSS